MVFYKNSYNIYVDIIQEQPVFFSSNSYLEKK